VISRLLYVSPDLLRRGWPFFALYLVLFAALTLVDGLSLTLFVQGVGADCLPYCHAVSALCVLLAVGAYLAGVDDLHPGTVFLVILSAPMALFAMVWVLICRLDAGGSWLGLLFVGRELAFALVLLHFGTYLQHYFTREDLNRVMPVVYAGGRVGGIAGGATLEYLCAAVNPADLLLVAVGMLGAGVLSVILIGRRLAALGEPERRPPEPRSPSDSEEAIAAQSFRDFLRFVLSNPLMFWITVTTIAYFFCRAFLNFRYSQFFETAFADDVEMASFLGRYTKYALTASLLLQLFCISRLIAWVGLKGAHMTYAVLLVAAALLGGLEMTLSTAVFARLVEGELRYGLRNPTAQLIVNQFSRVLRIRARAWSLGLLIPVSTFTASLILAAMVRAGFTAGIGLLTAGLGLGYLFASAGLIRHCERPGVSTTRANTQPAGAGTAPRRAKRLRDPVHGPAPVSAKPLP
jgi:ATP/ADP translocase